MLGDKAPAYIQPTLRYILKVWEWGRGQDRPIKLLHTKLVKPFLFVPDFVQETQCHVETEKGLHSKL